MPAPLSHPDFPPLLASPYGIWPGHVQAAYQSIHDSYLRARHLLDLDETDPLRLRYHVDRIQNETVAILVSLEGQQGLSQQWLENGAIQLGTLAGDLHRAIEGTEQR